MGCGLSKPLVIEEQNLPSPSSKPSVKSLQSKAKVSNPSISSNHNGAIVVTQHSKDKSKEKHKQNDKEIEESSKSKHSHHHHHHHHHHHSQSLRKGHEDENDDDDAADYDDQQQQQQHHRHHRHHRRHRHKNNADTHVNVASGSMLKLYESARVGNRASITKINNIPKHHEGEQVAAGWPAWLSAVAGEAIRGWIPRRADSFEKLDKIGSGTYSNVYKARDLDSRKIVALKKVRFDNLEPESVRFMAREILVLRRLDHPNVIKLEGLVTSRMSCSLYLVFEYMEHDLAGLGACPEITFTEAQVKCYMNQLISGLNHCHTRGVLHRDIKGSNLLLDNSGLLKIADFGLATFYCPNQNQPLTSRVVTLWYRPPELLLGATEYGVGVDLWSTGCILAELLAGKPIMPGRTEVEQLHKIFKLCGSPSEEYWRTSKLPHATIFKPQQPYRRCIAETFKDFPASSLALLDKLLAIEPKDRGTASDALKSEFFTTKPYACDPSSLPQYPPSKEMDAKLRDEESKRLRALAGKTRGDTSKKVNIKDRKSRAVPAPEANAELQENIQRRRTSGRHSHKSKSEKFPPPHEDSSVGFFIDRAQQAEKKNNSLVYVPGLAEKNHSMVYMPKDTAASSSFSQSVYTRSQRKKLGGDAQRVPSQTRGKSTSVSELFSSTHLPSITANKDSKDKKLNHAEERNTHAPNHVSFTEVN